MTDQDIIYRMAASLIHQQDEFQRITFSDRGEPVVISPTDLAKAVLMMIREMRKAESEFAWRSMDDQL